jgi:predicted phosphoadenosine phosphosulfate sulfurtransferase
MRLYLKKNVYEAALDRIRWCYDEFEHVSVCFSGGKDSTVVANLAIQVAREKGRLPVPLFFIDHEYSWHSAISYIRKMMDRPDVIPRWFQGHTVVQSITNKLQHCWKPGGDWVREKEPDCLKIDFGTTEPYLLFAKYMEHFYGRNACQLGGVRGAESSGRIKAVTSDVTYEGITWGKIINKERKLFDFYPIYDWGTRDVWKAIHDGGWEYCKAYDLMFQQGYDLDEMRLSHLHSNTALVHLQRAAELEPETWESVLKAVPGANTLSHLKEDYSSMKELPVAFSDWEEYRDYLLEHLVEEGERGNYLRRFENYEGRFGKSESLTRYQVNSILVGDRDGVRLKNWASEFSVREKNVLTRRNPQWERSKRG